jgi:ABC-type transport system involved in multi-copper enzyme maturation permease subunit
MKIALIAKNTFKESVRDRILYNLVLFGILMISSSLLLGAITIGNVKQIIINLGLSTLSIFGTLIAIIIGTQLVYKEIDKKTIYSLLAKPVARYEFIIGKFLGLALTLAINVSAMVAGIYLTVLYLNRTFQVGDLNILAASLVIYVELLLVVSIALCFSTFSTPTLSAFFTLLLYVMGHFNADLLLYARLQQNFLLKWILKSSYYLLPNFGNFAVISRTAHGFSIAGDIFIFILLYGVVYSSGLLLLALLIFHYRNFK